MNFSRINPITGDIASEAVAMQVEDMPDIVKKAHSAFKQWSLVGPNARRTILMKAAAAMESRKDDFVSAMMNETGSTAGWALFNLTLSVSMLREAASLTTHVSGEIIPSDKPGCLAMAQRHPVGVILGIAPWNAPIILGTRAISTALACGNAVILKASEICPLTHKLIIDSLNDAGFPENTVNIVTNAPEDAPAVVGALIDAKEVKRINFTGSTDVGRIIATRAAQNLKPCLLELGGKAPLLVLEDADVEEAVKAASFGAFMNQGQICMSTERLIVVDAIADDFARNLVEKVKTMTAGDPREARTPLGAVVDLKTIHKVNFLIDDAVSKGAQIIAGGKSGSVLMSATVLDHVTSEMEIYSEESFGPIVAMIRARDESDAVRIANDSEYGLSSAIFTKDIAKGLRLSKQIQSGICHINGATVHDEAQMPFGGVGSSGYGRFGGNAGIDQFTEIRWVTVETELGHYPI